MHSEPVSQCVQRQRKAKQMKVCPPALVFSWYFDVGVPRHCTPRFSCHHRLFRACTEACAQLGKTWYVASYLWYEAHPIRYHRWMPEMTLIRSLRAMLATVVSPSHPSTQPVRLQCTSVSWMTCWETHPDLTKVRDFETANDS